MNINKIKSIILLGILISISACSSDTAKEDEGIPQLYKTFSFKRLAESTSNSTDAIAKETDPLGFGYNDIVEATFTKSGTVTFKDFVESSVSGTFKTTNYYKTNLTLEITIENIVSEWSVTNLSDLGFSLRNIYRGGTILYDVKVGEATFKPTSDLSIKEKNISVYDESRHFIIKDKTQISKKIYGDEKLYQNLTLANNGDNITGKYATGLVFIKVKNISSFDVPDYFSAEKAERTRYTVYSLFGSFGNKEDYKSLKPNEEYEIYTGGYQITDLDNGFYYLETTVDPYKQTNDVNRDNNKINSSIRFQIVD